MFGEYAQIATYVQSSRESLNQSDGYNSDPMPAYLRPSFMPPLTCIHRKEKSGLTEDFIMVAEFSELEGPKPVMTIPKDGGSTFDQNTFAVKILAVDHQHSSEGFTITEDAQVVYSDLELGVFAFVHHLVLFDNTARGFVRPYCIAYITAQRRKIMYFYEEISWQLKKAARYLKYGNRMVFVGDLERHLKDLDHTKGFLLNQVSKIRLKDTENGESGQDVRKNAEAELYKGLQTIRQSNLEIMEILSILKPLLSDRRLEARFKLLEERAYQSPSRGGADNLSLQENWYNDLSSLHGLDARCGSLNEPRLSPLTLFKPKEYKPHLVETKKAKRFNAALRGLHELCSWGAKEGLKKLRSIHDCFKRDMTLLLLDRNESQMRYPSLSTVCHADCMTGNFLSGTFMDRTAMSSNCNTEEVWSTVSRGSFGSFDSLESFKSADSQAISLAMQEGSPSSVRTADSQAYNKFESAPSSPKMNDFSLLMENEYYSDDETPMNENENYPKAVFCNESGSSISEKSGQDKTSQTECQNGDKSINCDTVNQGKNGEPESSHGMEKNNQIGQNKSPSFETGYDANLAVIGKSADTFKNGVPGANAILKKTALSSAPNIKLDSQENLETIKSEVLSETNSGLRDTQDDSCRKETHNKDSLLSSLIAEEEAQKALDLNTDTLRASPFRPHTPYPCPERSSEQRKVSSSTQGIPVPGKSSRSETEDSSECIDERPRSGTITALTHNLVSLGAVKVRADSDNSSVFTEVSTMEVFPHLFGAEGLSYSSRDESSHFGATDDLDPSDDYVNIPSTTSSQWKPKCGLLSVGDWVNNLGHGKPGYNLAEVFISYHNLHHVIASLLTGRPVLIAGCSKYEAEVCWLVNALSVFVGGVRRKRHHAVLEWTSKPPRMTDLTRLRLVGVCRPNRRSLESFIPAAVRQTCSIMDVEKRTIVAPPYQGQFIMTLLSKKKIFKTDAQLLSYVHWWLTDLMSKTFVFYHSFCLSSSGSIIYSQSAKDQRDSYCRAVSSIMAKLCVRDSDSEILEHLTELVKTSQLEQSGVHSANAGSEAVPIPLQLHLKVCQTFRC